MSGADHVRLDHEVVVDEIGGKRVVGVNAADPRRRKQDGLRPNLLHKAIDLDGVTQIARGARRGDDLAALAFEASDQRRAYQAAMTGDPNPLTLQLVSIG